MNFIFSSTEYDRAWWNLECKTTFNNLEKCDMPIEAVFKDLKLKQNVLAELGHCVFASNISALPIHELVANSRRPQKVSSQF